MSKFWKDAQNAFENIKSRTNTAIESGKLNFEITQLRNRIIAVHKEIGKYVQEQAVDEVKAIAIQEGFVAEKLNEIRFYEKKIAEIKKQNEDLYRQQQREKEEAEKKASEQAAGETKSDSQPEKEEHKSSEDATSEDEGKNGGEKP